ncbi:uncharacterized protein LOC113209080 isoform X3 [Frankliniella occidentalis]|uniref:Uncharacterized protein LOC113209080 isoform X3 n=1 Tax=Frankliniella occidentalis TaxID=133901 RepID=A0A6J1SN50_FRAOC|nr:uncharacterized protein LOC113209080 isoform X3 [Frankliniella occidentalis]
MERESAPLLWDLQSTLFSSTHFDVQDGWATENSQCSVLPSIWKCLECDRKLADMSPVFIGDGFRKKSRFYYKGDGFYYYKNRTLVNESASLRCINWKRLRCPGRAVASKDWKSLTISTDHTCMPNYNFCKVRKLRQAIIARCSSRDTTRPKTIVSQESECYSRDIRLQCSAKILRSAIRRARMRVVPRLPHTLSQLDEVLRSEQFKHLTMTKSGDGYLYAGSCGSARMRSRCLIFQSPTMKEIMCTSAKEVFADATWDGRPSCPNSSQVFSMTTLLNNQILPLCVCLMESKSEHTYTILLQAIKELNPGFKPDKIHTDFEFAEYNSFKKIFVDAIVEGCLYHYSNNLSAQANKLGLARFIAANETIDSLVRSCLAIPLVPTPRIPEALAAVMTRASEENFYRVLDPFFKYVYEEYIAKRTHVLSVYGSENRTNNVAESWNNSLQLAMNVRRPNVFNFIKQAAQDYFDINRGENTTRGRKVSALVNDARICNLTRLLDRNQITMSNFLRNASRTLENPYRRHCPRPPPQV